jgi:hypothetical protein
MKTKLIAVDLDGTLLKNDETLSLKGIKALQQAAQQGILVVIATGRGLQSVRRYAKKLGIFQPVIVVDGAQIFSAPDGHLWQQYTIPMDVARSIAAFADSNNWELTTLIGSTTYYRQRPDQALGELELGRIICGNNTDGIKQAPHRILTHEPDAIPRLWEFCLKSDFMDIRWQRFYNPDGKIRSLCISPSHANKGQALKYLCRKLNIDLSQTMAIGDYDNDLSMFEVAGRSVAMGNALEHIKAKADRVAPSNEDDGVAWAIEAFALS